MTFSNIDRRTIGDQRIMTYESISRKCFNEKQKGIKRKWTCSDLSNLSKNSSQRIYEHTPWFLWGPALCVQMDFTRTFDANTKCNNISYVWSHFYQILVVLKHQRCLWNNIYDRDISRSTNIPKIAKYTPLMLVFMHLKMSVSKILFHRRLWYFRTTKIW